MRRLVQETEVFSKLWRVTLGDPHVRIAVLDGPIDSSHAAFQGAALWTIDGIRVPFVATNGPATEHGTHVASIIFGQHEGHIKGIVPRCTGLSLPIFDNSPCGGLLKCSQIELAHAIRLAVDHGAHVINISGGEFTPSGITHPILAEVLDHCDRQGVLIVAAAGNDGCDCLHIPAAHPSVLAVGAANAVGEPLETSNWGSQYQEHGLLALGENVGGAAPGGEVSTRSGTSSAAAIVSGVAGLLMSLQFRRGIAPNGPQIRKILLESSDPCPSVVPSTCRRYLSGVLNVGKALSLLSQKEVQMSLHEPNTRFEASSSDAVARPAEASEGFYAEPRLPGGSTQLDPLEMRASRPDLRPMVRVAPSACSCGGGNSSRPQLVFAFGQIDIGFVSRARLDSIAQHMHDKNKKTSPKPSDPRQLLKYLSDNPWDATSVVWTLNMESVPVYAISVDGPNSEHIVKYLKQFVTEQLSGKIERVSIAGVLGGRIGLMSGEELPVIHPEVRGMSSWGTVHLLDEAAGIEDSAFLEQAAFLEDPFRKAPAAQPEDRLDAKKKGIVKFLHRVYTELRNPGIKPRDRAINYSATNVFEIGHAFDWAASQQMELRSINATPSPVCRLGSDCWDVQLEFFFPHHATATLRRVYQFTVDVSDVVPVTVGSPQIWSTAD